MVKEYVVIRVVQIHKSPVEIKYQGSHTANFLGTIF